MHIAATQPAHPDAQAVLEFWLRDGLQAGWPTENLGWLWFGGGAQLDQDIDARFGHLVRDAAAGGLADWESSALDRLALVVLLDQFTRNVFRGQASAFAGDARAQALARDAFACGWDKVLPLAGRVFLTMPLTHAESLRLQDDAVHRMQALRVVAGAAHDKDLAGFVDFARKHRDIVAQFGRFPHRNAVLGRESTNQEQDFLRNGPRFGQ